MQKKSKKKPKKLTVAQANNVRARVHKSSVASATEHVNRLLTTSVTQRTGMAAPVAPVDDFRIDLGCGPNKKEGHVGVDAKPFPGVDYVLNIGKDPWPWKDASVQSAHCSHALEHLTAVERCHFMNELYRVLVPGGTCYIVTPIWSSNRAYGDPTHQWPPIGEMFFSYLSREFRRTQAPHTDKSNWPEGYDCDFIHGGGYTVHQDLLGKNETQQQYRINFEKEAAQDIIGTITKVAPPPSFSS